MSTKLKTKNKLICSGDLKVKKDAQGPIMQSFSSSGKFIHKMTKHGYRDIFYNTYSDECAVNSCQLLEQGCYNKSYNSSLQRAKFSTVYLLINHEFKVDENSDEWHKVKAD